MIRADRVERVATYEELPSRARRALQLRMGALETPVEREARIAAHAARIARELARMGALGDVPAEEAEQVLERRMDRAARRPWHRRLAQALVRLAAEKGALS